MTEGTSDLRLSDDEARAVATAVRAFVQALPDGQRGIYEDLLHISETRTVSQEQLPTVERIVALALETGHARRLGPDVELLLTSVARRTPLGAAHEAAVRDVNRALEVLADKVVRAARVSWRKPGHYELSMDVGEFRLVLGFSPDGVEVRRLDA